MRTLHTLTILLLAATASAACGADDLAAPENGTSGSGPQTPPTLAIVVAPSFATIDSAKSVRLTATLRLPTGTTTLNDVAWQTADSSIATVAADGTVHALRAGQVQIVATWNGRRGSSLVTVRNPVAKKPAPRCLQLRKTAGIKRTIPVNKPCS